MARPWRIAAEIEVAICELRRVHRRAAVARRRPAGCGGRL